MKSEVREKYAVYKALKDELEQAKTDEADRVKEIDSI